MGLPHCFLAVRRIIRGADYPSMGHSYRGKPLGVFQLSSTSRATQLISDVDVPHHGTGLTKTGSHSGAVQGNTYLNCETALNYETALLECASGSQSSIGKIYAREKNQLRAVAHRIVHDISRAEDVIHEAFAQILRDAKNFDPARGSARGWIYAIVRNTALKMRKHAKREFALEDDALNAISEREQAVPNPASCIPNSMTLRSMLDQLEPKRRASLLLTIIDGRTHEEIAEYLRVPVGTVKAWIRRELVAMRRQLE
jgi:RNA polymerase sigma-70 factor (ECF subfamily)